jgi:hypothetical protein
VTRSSSPLFDSRGRYRPAGDRRCLRCGHVLAGEDELGCYYQEPKEENFGPLHEGGPDTTLTFMERVHECGGLPHRLPSGILTSGGASWMFLSALGAGLLTTGLSLAGLISLGAQCGIDGAILAALTAAMGWTWIRTERSRAAQMLLLAVAIAAIALAAAWPPGQAGAAVMLLSEAVAATAAAGLIALRARRRAGGGRSRP